MITTQPLSVLKIFLLYLWVEQFLFKWSNIFIAGPHLSGLEFRGQRVTVGKEALFIGTTIVFEVEGISSQAKGKNRQINGNIHYGPSMMSQGKTPCRALERHLGFFQRLWGHFTWRDSSNLDLQLLSGLFFTEIFQNQILLKVKILPLLNHAIMSFHFKICWSFLWTHLSLDITEHCGPLTNFVSPDFKLHNRYCHIMH